MIRSGNNSRARASEQREQPGLPLCPWAPPVPVTHSREPTPVPGEHGSHTHPQTQAFQRQFI